MSITGISHIAIGVRDLDRSLEFYRDALGLTVTLEREEIDPPGGDEHHTRNRRAAYLRWELGPGTSYLVLDQHLATPVTEPARALYEQGVHHFAFMVDDIGATAARLREHGFQVRYEGHVGKGSGSGIPDSEGEFGIATLFADDPDGNIIQFDRWLD